MAAPLADRRGAAWPLAAAAALAGLAAGAALAGVAAPILHSRMLPWILGRALGLAAYLDATALVALGLWFRHPWRIRRPILHPAALLRTHAALAAAALALVAGHGLALVLDPYAGVGWVGAVVPGLARYRPVAVGLGTVAVDVGLAVGGSVALAGRIGRAGWHRLHRLGVAVFAIAWLHGVLAGSDTLALRPLYAATGGLVAVLWLTGRVARRPQPAAPAGPGSEASPWR